MTIADIFNEIPFAKHLGIEITEAADGHAEGRLELESEHSSNPARMIGHGGVTYSLADTVGGAAVVSLTEDVAPTIDMRMDYLAPVTRDIRAVADVVRDGGSMAVVEVEVYDIDETHVATAHGVYKTSGQDGENPWRADDDPRDGAD
jgi:uncharacterized protein (TIGR00369 family)